MCGEHGCAQMTVSHSPRHVSDRAVHLGAEQVTVMRRDG